MTRFLPLTFALLLLSAPAYAAKGGEVFDAWAVRCEGADKDRKCETFQRLTLAETGQRVVELAIGFTKRGNTRSGDLYPQSVAAASSANAAHGVVVLPLGIMLPDGVMLNVDKNRYAFQIRYCTPDGCYAYIDLPRSILDRMSRAMDANITFRTMDKQDISLPITLKGFNSALQSIQ